MQVFDTAKRIFSKNLRYYLRKRRKGDLVCSVANVKKIYLIGFDGYLNDKKKNNEMNDIFEEYNRLIDKKEIISITKTKYRIAKKIIL